MHLYGFSLSSGSSFGSISALYPLRGRVVEGGDGGTLGHIWQYPALGYIIHIIIPLILFTNLLYKALISCKEKCDAEVFYL